MGTLLFIAGFFFGAAVGCLFGFKQGMIAEAEEADRPYCPPMSAAELASAFGEGR